MPFGIPDSDRIVKTLIGGMIGGILGPAGILIYASLNKKEGIGIITLASLSMPASFCFGVICASKLQDKLDSGIKTIHPNSSSSDRRDNESSERQDNEETTKFREAASRKEGSDICRTH